MNHKDISIEETGLIVNPEKEKKQANIPEGWMKDKDNKDKHDTSNKTNTNISKPIETEGVPQIRKGKNPPSKVKIKKRGRLEEREMVEIKKTNRSMMSWLVGKVSKPTQVQLEPEPEEMDWQDRDREEKVARVERKKLEWASTKLSRSVLLDMVNDTVSFVENKHLVRMMSEVVDEAWRRVEVRRLVWDITDCEDEIQQRVEQILSTRRAEEKELAAALVKEEAKQKRLKRIIMIKEIWKKKLEATNLKRMLRMLRKLSLEDLEMDVDVVELKALEMMEVEDQLIENEEMELGELDNEESDHNDRVYLHHDMTTTLSTIDVIKKSPNVQEYFGDIKTMLAFWESLEKEESTPIQEKVVVRRRSQRLESLVGMMGMKQDTNLPNNTSTGGRNSNLISTFTKPQTSVYQGWNSDQLTSVDGQSSKRKRESGEGLESNKRIRGFGAL